MLSLSSSDPKYEIMINNMGMHGKQLEDSREYFTKEMAKLHGVE